MSPAAVFGGTVDQALANRLLNDMGADPDQLPLMQHALMRMWLRASGRTTSAVRSHELKLDGARGDTSAGLATATGMELSVEDYKAVGTIREALSRHADAAFESLDEEGQRIAEKLFRCLSERTGKRRDTRRPTRLSEVAAVAGVTPEKVMEVVEVFRKPGRSFVTPPAGRALDETSVLDISHESLIRQWGRMSGWVEAEARSGDTYRRLEETARLWARHLAAPWRRPDLDLALTWKALERPTLEWSKRYGTDFDLAMEFLDESERQRRERMERRERARERELEQAKTLAEAEKRKADAEHQLAQEQATVIRRWRKFSIALGLTALAAVIGIALAMKLLTDIKARDRMLTESRLSNRALLTLDTDPTLAVLLAAEARHDLHSGEAADKAALHETTLLRVLSAFFNVEAPRNLHEGARSLAFSPVCEQHEWLAVVDRHGAAQVWAAGDTAELPLELGKALDVVFSPDCRWLASLEATGVVSLRPMSAPAGSVVHQLEAAADAQSLVYSDGGRWLAAVGAGGVDLWDLGSDEPLAVSRIPEGASQIAFGPDDNQLATALGGTVTLWSLDGPVRRIASMRHEIPVSALEFSPMAEPRWLATASGPTAYLWDVSARPGERAYELRGHRQVITDLEFSPNPLANDYWLATASLDRSIRLWHLRYLDDPDPARTPKVVPHPTGVTTLAFRPPDGRWIATGGEDSQARVWDITTLATSDAMALPHGESVSLLAFRADGTSLVTGSSSRPARLWRLDQPTALPVIAPFEGKISSLAFRADASSATPWLATASRYEIRLFDDLTDNREVGREEISRSRERGKFEQIEFSRDGAWLAARGENNVVTLHPVAGDSFGPAISLDGERPVIAVSPEGDWLATSRSDTAGGGDEIWLSSWQLDAGGRPVESKLLVAPDRVTQLAIGGSIGEAGPHWLAAAGLGRAAWLWDLSQSTPRPILIPQEERVASIAFSRDGRWLVTGDWDDAAHVWDLESASGAPRLHRRLPHRDAVRTALFSPDGLWLATGSGDHQARLWSVQDDFIELLSLAHRDAVVSLAFGPEGRWFATGSLDNLLRVIPLDRTQLHAAACRAAGENLSRQEWSEFLPGQEYHPTCDEFPAGN